MALVLDDIIQELTDDQYVKLGEFLIKVYHIQNLPSFDHSVLQDPDYYSYKNSLCEGSEWPLQWDASVIKTKEFTKSIGKLTPKTLREGMWANIMHEDPDMLIVRHLKAREWDVDAALLMLINSVAWRTEFDLNELIAGGDEKIKETAENGSGEDQKVAAEVMTQLRSGKTFTNGVDKVGRPLLFTRVQLHDPNAQSFKAMERYAVFQSESARLLLRPPITTAAIIFDLGGFSRANMDWNAVKLMTVGLEDKYPESTGVTYVYRAPWIINGIWNIVKNWMPGNEAAKVRFIKNAEELSQFVDLKYLPTEMGGTGDFEFKYTEPIPGENEMMKNNTAKRDEIRQERENLANEYEKMSLEWLELSQLERAQRGDDCGGDMSAEAITEAMKKTKSQTSSQALTDRREIMVKIRQNYYKLDPYVRGRIHGDRVKTPQVGEPMAKKG